MPANKNAIPSVVSSMCEMSTSPDMSLKPIANLDPPANAIKSATTMEACMKWCLFVGL